MPFWVARDAALGVVLARRYVAGARRCGFTGRPLRASAEPLLLGAFPGA
jgi:hypothetical protein